MPARPVQAPTVALLPAGCRLRALCACGPLGLCGGDESAALEVLAGVLLGRVERLEDRLRVASPSRPALELHAVPETDWMAWESFCESFARCAPRAGEGAPVRRLLSFRPGSGPLPDISESEPRCGWTRRWLRGNEPHGFSAAATPGAPPAGW